MNIDNMEMPCMCDCGNWLELNDGRSSKHSNKLVCPECFKREQEEAAFEQEVSDLSDAVSDAEHTIQESKKRLVELGVFLEKKLLPLSALIEAQHDCDKIFVFAFGKSYTSRFVGYNFLQLQGEVEGEIMQIHFDGYLRIAWKFYSGDGSRRSHFALIDYIRQLGYDHVTSTH